MISNSESGDLFLFYLKGKIDEALGINCSISYDVSASNEIKIRIKIKDLNEIFTLTGIEKFVINEQIMDLAAEHMIPQLFKSLFGRDVGTALFTLSSS